MFRRVVPTLSAPGSSVLMAILIALGATFAVAQGTAYFTPTDSMSTPRQSVAAAVLEGGTVLFAAGDMLSPVAQLYDPIAERFSPTGSLTHARAEADAVRLDDGRVLVVGGTDGTAALSSAELYDPRSGAFAMAGNMLFPRVRPAVAKLPSGRILILGGHDGRAALATAELYDPATGIFASTGSMAAGRIGTATTLENGTVLVIGTELDGVAAAAELFDPGVAGFRPTGNLNVPREGHTATRLANGQVLVTGGLALDKTPLSAAELYDAASGSFRLAGNMSRARYGHRAVLLADGAVLLVGGRDATGPLRTTEIYDPASLAFTADASLIEPRVSPTVVALPDNGAVVAGGRGSNDQALATVERYRRQDGRHATSTRLASSLALSTYGQAITYTATVTSGDMLPSGRVRFFDGGVLFGEATLDGYGNAALTTSSTPAGIRAISAMYLGSTDFKPSESPAIEQTVAKATATGSFTITPIQRQYSDLVTFAATVSPPAAAQSVTFKVGTTVIGSADVVGGKATLQTPVLATMPLGSRIVTAVFNQEEQNYAIANVAKSMSIVKEDARITVYGGTTYTACPTCNTAKVLLRATVKDISVTPEANGDVNPGDIRNATVTFINRTVYGTIATVPVTADASNPTSGQAVYEWTVDLGSASSKSFKVGYAVGGLYTRNTYDYVVVSVSRPKE